MVPSRQSPIPPGPAHDRPAPAEYPAHRDGALALPDHTLTKCGRVTIHITRTNAQGALDLRWTVSYNEHYGPPRQLAYKLDTVVINQRLDAPPRPLPRCSKWAV